VSDSEPITHELRVRYAECDAQGIVFNARWFEYFDVAMTEFWREVIGGYNHLPAALGVETVVAETGARFRGAGRFDDVLTFVMHVRRIGTSSMRIEIDALRDDSLLCEGFIEYVFVTPSDLTPVEIPERLLGLLPDVSTGA
jgi:acyl-CoA thioester hydrolase